MTSKTFTPTIILGSFCVLLICFFVFGSLLVGSGYLLGAFSVVVVFMTAYYYAERNYYRLNSKQFVKKIFWFSIILRVSSVLIVYFILYDILGGDLGIEEYDTIFYDENAKRLNNFYTTGVLSPEFVSIFFRFGIDDFGYIFILSLQYFLTDALLVTKLIQTIVDSFSVVLMYKVLQKIYGTNVAKTGAIILSVFYPFILFSGLHTKEVYMIFFMLLAINTTMKLVNDREAYNAINIVLFCISIIAIFSMRIILGLIIVVSILGYFLLAKRVSISRKVIALISLGLFFFTVLSAIGLLDEFTGKALGYLGVEYGDAEKLGGRSTGEYQRKGQSFAQYATGIVLLPISFITPFPSFVETNIKEAYGMTMQWFFSGGLLIWVYISFFSFIGFYKSIKNNFRKNSLLIFISSFYIVALLVSVYITSIRFNVPKMLILIMFVAYGLHNQSRNTIKYFGVYMIVSSVLILLWNYIKVAGRGLV